MSKKYKQVAVEKTDREAIIACLDFLLGEFDRLSKQVDDSCDTVITKLNGEEK